MSKIERARENRVKPRLAEGNAVRDFERHVPEKAARKGRSGFEGAEHGQRSSDGVVRRKSAGELRTVLIVGKPTAMMEVRIAINECWAVRFSAATADELPPPTE